MIILYKLNILYSSMNNWIYYTLYTVTVNLFYMFNNVIIEYYVDLYSYPFIVSIASLGTITIYNCFTLQHIYMISNITNTAYFIEDGNKHIYGLLILNGICIGVSNILYITTVNTYKNKMSELISLHKCDILFTTICASIWFNARFDLISIILILIFLISFNRSISNDHIYTRFKIGMQNELDEPLLSDVIMHNV